MLKRFKMLLSNDMRAFALVMSTGFAMFAMFFGSGNLVFPLLAGKVVESAYGLTMLGFVLTGVAMPFLGLLGVLLYEGSYKKFLSTFGLKIGFLMALIMLVLLGPFGVVPRCITVSFGSFAMISKSLNLPMFSFIMCSVVFLLSFNENRVVPLLGAFLAPIKIGSVGIIIAYGLLFSEAPKLTNISTYTAFEEGIFKGYQTMDLLAAFFFATVIIRHLKNASQKSDNPRGFFKLSLFSMLLGAGLLAIVYAGLVFLGATYAEQLNQYSSEKFLSVIAHLTLGEYAGIFVSIAIILSCLTTAIALATVFTDFLFEQVLVKKIPRTVCLGATMLMTFIVSTFGFQGIANFLSPILKLMYPGLIGLTLLNLFLWGWKRRLKKQPQISPTILS